MFSYYFLASLLATIVFIAILYPFAIRIGFTDKPCHRKQHKTPTPIIGGLAIYLALLVVLFLSKSPFPNQNEYLVAATLLVSVGLIDDYKNLSVKIRLVVQIIAAIIMVTKADIRITTLGDLFGFGNIELGQFSTLFTIFAVVGGINAFNMVDGMDGLVGSLTLITIASIAEVAWIAQNTVVLQYSLVFLGGIIGFLLFNLRIFGRPSAKIFLGDTGSTLFGFTVCWLAIGATQGDQPMMSPITVLWVIGLPLIDSVCIMARRLVKKRSPFSPDREHLHHLFIVSGYGINSTLIIILTFSLILAVNGIAAGLYLKVPEALMFIAFIGLFASYYWLMTHAWVVMKISRYLRITKLFDRRISNLNPLVEKRSGKDRRFRPSPQEIDSFHRGRSFFLASLFKHQVKENAANFESKSKKDK